MKGEVKTPVIVVVAAIILLLLGFGVKKALTAGDLDTGQVKYTPGVPPWLDPLQKDSKHAGAPQGQMQSGSKQGN
jgi:hypothetical protein